MAELLRHSAAGSSPPASEASGTTTPPHESATSSSHQASLTHAQARGPVAQAMFRVERTDTAKEPLVHVGLKAQEAATSTQPDLVRAHDIFNLCALAPLCALCLNHLATGTGFEVFWLATMAYFVVDIAFIGALPGCVKSPKVILGHHVLTSLYILVPWLYPDYARCMSYAMLIEINTFFLIARRVFKFNALLQFAFYATWFSIRNVWYPYLIYLFYQEWVKASVAFGTPFNPIAVTPVFQAILTALNFHWTVPLVKGLLKNGFMPESPRGGPRSSVSKCL